MLLEKYDPQQKKGIGEMKANICFLPEWFFWTLVQDSQPKQSLGLFREAQALHRQWIEEFWSRALESQQSIGEGTPQPTWSFLNLCKVKNNY
jgi:hypothetical protein